MRSLCGAPRQRAPALGWHIRWGLHIDLACTKRRRLWILLREEGAFGAHTLKLPSLWQGRAGGQHGHIGHGTTSFFRRLCGGQGPCRGRWTHHTRPGGPSLLSEPHTRAAVSRVSTRCPVGAWSLRGPTLPTDDTVSARAAYTRADRLDTGRLAHPRALRLSSGPRPFLGYRVGGHAPAARGSG